MFKQILFPIDLQEEEARLRALAFDKAVEFCRIYSARLNVLTVVPDMGMPVVGYYFPDATEDGIVKEFEKLLHDLVSKNIPEDINVLHMVAQGKPYKQILKMAENIKADLIIMPAQQKRLQDFLIGSNASRVVRFAKCSVLVIRTSFESEFVPVSS